MTSTYAEFLFGPTAFLIAVFLIATPFMLYSSQTSVMYIIRPLNCDAQMFINEESWFTGNWVLIPAYGVCPVDAYDYTYVTGYAYQNCMSFFSNSKWGDMDVANTAGQSS
jgi:hypothetical protein